MADSALQIRPLAPAIGAEISGIDLSRPLDDDDWAAIHEAFLEHLVVFFRDQPLTPEQHLAFARRFGALEPYPFVDGIPGHPELIEIVKMPDEVGNFGGSWHTDMSFRERPPLGAVLWARQVPEAGGDTMFANMYLAYDSLSPGLQNLLRDLEAVHDSFEPARHSDPVKYKGMHNRAKAGERETHVQPLVRVHPETGRAALYISPYYTTRIEGMTEAESRPLLDFLANHAAKPEFTCRFNWAPYSIAVWDNRCSLHNALDDDFTARATGRGFKRVMRRATIAGDRPRGPNDSQPAAAGEAKRRQPPELGRKTT